MGRFCIHRDKNEICATGVAIGIYRQRGDNMRRHPCGNMRRQRGGGTGNS